MRRRIFVPLFVAIAVFFSGTLLTGSTDSLAFASQNESAESVSSMGFAPGESYVIEIVDRATGSTVIHQTVTADSDGNIGGIFDAILEPGIYDVRVI